MSTTINPLYDKKKLQLERFNRRNWNALVESPGKLQAELAREAKIKQSTKHEIDPNNTVGIIKEIASIPSLLTLDTRDEMSSHSVLFIPRTGAGKVGSLSYWVRETAEKDDGFAKKGDKFWYNPITEESVWVKPKYGSTTPPSLEIFEPNGASAATIDKMYKANFTKLIKDLEDRGVKVTISEKFQSTSGLSAPICYKHTIARWLNQDIPLPEYKQHLLNVAAAKVKQFQLPDNEATRKLINTDHAVAAIYDDIVTHSIQPGKYIHDPENPSETRYERTGTDTMLLSTIKNELDKLEKRDTNPPPPVIERLEKIRDTTDRCINNISISSYS